MKYIASLADSPALKAVAAALGGALGYIFPTSAVLETATIAAILIVVDTITGLWASLVTGKPIESRKASRMLTKLVGYCIAVATVSLTVRSLPSLGHWQVGACTGILAIVIATEAVSIIENLERIGVKLPRKLVKALKGELKRLNDAEVEPTT
jgi:phage-related holin